MYSICDKFQSYMVSRHVYFHTKRTWNLVSVTCYRHGMVWVSSTCKIHNDNTRDEIQDTTKGTNSTLSPTVTENTTTTATTSTKPILSKGIKLVPHSRSLKVWQAVAENMKQQEFVIKVKKDITQQQQEDTKSSTDIESKIWFDKRTIQNTTTSGTINTQTNNNTLPKGIRLVPHSRSLKLWNVLAQNIKDMDKDKKKS